MDKAFTRMSRFLAIGGVAAIVFGVIALFWPGISLVALTALFGAYAFVYGVFALGAGLELIAHKSTEWVAPTVGGIAGIVVAVITFVHPGVTVLALTYLIAAFAFVIGVSMIVWAIEFWGDVDGAVWIALSGVASVLFGILVAVQPGSGILAIVWVIGIYAIVAGVLQLVGSYRMHQMQTSVKKTFGAAQPAQPTAS